MALFGGAWWIRGGAAARPDAMVLGLEAIGLGLLGAGGYVNGTLVSRNLIGVDHRYAQAGKWREETIDARKDQPVTVAKEDELKVDQMMLLRVGDKRIVLARTEKGLRRVRRPLHAQGRIAGGRCHDMRHGSMPVARFPVRRLDRQGQGGPAKRRSLCIG